MHGDVPVESLEEGDAVTDQNRQDGVANFVSQPSAQTFASDRTAANKPDAAEAWLQPIFNEPFKIARVEIDCAPPPG